MKKQKHQKNGQRPEEQDNRTIADMNVDGMPWYTDQETEEKRKQLRDVNVSKDERRAMLKGAYTAILPVVLIGVALFCLAFGLIILYLWLVSR